MATEKQVAANRLNGLKGGVKTPEGKAISRLNARKHGIFATVLTEHDAEELRGLLDELIADLKPVGILEQLLVDKLAVTYLRMRRCAKAETAYYQDQWNSGSGRPGRFRYSDTVVNIGLYDARLTHQFLRLLREIESRRKVMARAGAALPITAQEAAPHLPHPTPSVTPLNEPQLPEPPPAQAKPALEPRNQGTPLPQVKNEPNLPQTSSTFQVARSRQPCFGESAGDGLSAGPTNICGASRIYV
jgi:hypothetical protein